MLEETTIKKKKKTTKAFKTIRLSIY